MKSAGPAVTDTSGAMPTSSMTWSSAVVLDPPGNGVRPSLRQGKRTRISRGASGAVADERHVRQLSHRGDKTLIAAGTPTADEQQHVPAYCHGPRGFNMRCIGGPKSPCEGPLRNLTYPVTTGVRAKRPATSNARSSLPPPFIRTSRMMPRRVAKALEHGVEVGRTDAVRSPAADRDVRYTVEHAVAPVALSLRPVCAADVLLPHRSVPVNEALRIVRSAGPSRRGAKDHVHIVKMPEHLADDADEPELIGGRHRSWTIRRSERVPVDPFVIEVGVPRIEGRPERIELVGEVCGRDGRCRCRRRAVGAAAAPCRRTDRQEEEHPNWNQSTSHKSSRHSRIAGSHVRRRVQRARSDGCQSEGRVRLAQARGHGRLLSRPRREADDSAQRRKRGARTGRDV